MFLNLLGLVLEMALSSCGWWKPALSCAARAAALRTRSPGSRESRGRSVPGWLLRTNSADREVRSRPLRSAIQAGTLMFAGQMICDCSKGWKIFFDLLGGDADPRILIESTRSPLSRTAEST